MYNETKFNKGAITTMDIGAVYTQWATNRYFDEDSRKELEAIEGNNIEIRDRFYKELDFGTAGIRGVIGAGTNRMNKYVVRRLSTAIAAHILSKGTKAKKDGVVIGYDSRNFSDVFAKEAAAVFAGNGIKVYLHTDIVLFIKTDYLLIFLMFFFLISCHSCHQLDSFFPHHTRILPFQSYLSK